MNVVEFYNELAFIVARYPELADNGWIFDMHLPKKKKEITAASGALLTDLFEYLDLLQVQTIGGWFNKEVIAEDTYYWIGARDTDKLLVDKTSGEVVLMTADDDCSYYLAANLEDYLSVVVAYSDYSIKGFLGYVFNEYDRHAMRDNCLRIVRQEKYFPFYQDSFQ